MAISTQAAVKAKRRAFHAVQTLGVSVADEFLLHSLFQQLSQQYGNPDLQVVENVSNSTTDIVVADAPCKLYALVLKGGSSAADYRHADHASSANTPTTTIPVAISANKTMIIPAGESYSNGITMDASGANGWKSIHIIGAP